MPATAGPTDVGSAAVDLLAVVGADTHLKKVATTNGGEYAGPCPWCGGEDRFRVWPEEGRWWCRACHRKGDPAGYIMQRDGVSYPEACQQLGLDTGNQNGHVARINTRRLGCESVKPRSSGCETDVKRRETDVKSGLSLANLALAKKLPEPFLASLGLRDVRLGTGPAVAIPYVDADGGEVALRYRLALTGDSRFRWKKGAAVQPYGLARLADARKAGWVLLVEGESDCWTAWHTGVPAVGLPGKTIWRREWAAYLAGLDVYMWQEPDAEDFPIRLGKDLLSARVIVAPGGAKDISQVHVAGGDVAALVAELKTTARPVGDIIAERSSAELVALAIEAAPLLSAPDPLSVIKTAIRELGYGGDMTPALVTYLAVTTRLLTMRPGTMPAHLLLVGPPSAGKSYTVQVVLRLLPGEGFHVIDAGSPRLLIYDDADIQHKAVIFSEADSLPASEDNPAASAVRNLLQDHHLHYGVTVRDANTGEYTIKEIDKPGPSVLLTTAVRELSGQLGSRVFTLAVPEDGARIQDALAVQAEIEVNGAIEVAPATVAFQAYLQRLAPIDVVVPFAREIAAAVGKVGATRVLRDYARLLSLVKAVAILRHRHRGRNADGRLVADLADYATVFELVGPMYEATLTGATEQIREVVAAVAGLRQDGRPKVSYSAVAAVIGLHPEQVKRLARQAIRRGWLTNEESRKSQPADLNIGDPLPSRVGLPTLGELAAAFEQSQPTASTGVATPALQEVTL